MGRSFPGKIYNLPEIAVFAAYLCYFIALFSQFPMNGGLPGNIDSWQYLFTHLDHKNLFNDFVTGSHHGHAFYPNSNYLFLGEAVYVGSIIFNGLDLFFNHLWSLTLLVCIYYALSAFTAYLLTQYITGSRVAGLLGGLFYSSSNYMLSNLDNENAMAVFCLPLVILLFLKWSERFVPKYLFAMAAVLIIALYSSMYQFVLSIFALLLILLIKRRAALQLFSRSGFYAFLFFVAGISYFLYSYVAYSPVTGPISQEEAESMYRIIEYHSLDFRDFFRVLPGNLIYRPMDDIGNPWLYMVKSSFLGVSILILAVAGLFRKFPLRTYWILLLVLSAVIALGPAVKVGASVYKLPVGYLYDQFPHLMSFRYTYRAFNFVALGLAVMAGAGFRRGITRFGLGRAGACAAALAVGVAFFCENVPVPFKKSDMSDYTHDYQYFKSRLTNELDIQTIAHLPVKLFHADDREYARSLNVINREYFYMYWQTGHQQNVLNGILSFATDRMIDNYERMERFTADDMKWLIEYNDIDYFVFSESMVIYPEERDVWSVLSESEDVILEKSSDGHHIYRVRN